MKPRPRRFSKSSQERRWIETNFPSPKDQHHQIGLHPTLATEQEDWEAKMWNKGMNPRFEWQTNHYRARQAIKRNINEAIRVTPLDRLVFFTFTFRPPLPVPSNGQFVHARKCFRDAAKVLLKQVFSSYLSVLDIHETGRPHFHGLAITHSPIREGFDEVAYDAYMARTKWAEWGAEKPLPMKTLRQLRDGVSSNPNLREIWQLLDDNLPGYGFGPMIGVFPLRKVPKHACLDAAAPVDACGPEFMSSAVAGYLARAYVRSVPAVNKTGIRTRIYNLSKNFPSKIRVGDIVSQRFVDAKVTLATLFEIDPNTGFAEKIGQHWGLIVADLADALDACLENDRGRAVEWRGQGETPWLALAVVALIQQEMSFDIPFAQFLPRLERLCSGYVPAGYEPRLVGFVPSMPMDL